MPDCYWLKSLNDRRLDAWHYKPEFQGYIDKIKANFKWDYLHNLIDNKRGIAGGATPLGAKYLQNGEIKFYRTSEVNECFLDYEQAVFITNEQDNFLKRSRLAAGDVILTITGAKFGKSAVINNKHIPGNISQHSVRFKPFDALNVHYLVAYLNCDIGQKIIWREAYGATRPAIDFPSIRFLTIPTPLQVTQTYIGNKVLQAVLLREWAKQIEHNVTLFNIALMPNQEGLDFSSKTRQVPVSKMTERLDAHFYPAVVEQYLSDSSVNFEQLSLLCDAIFNGQTQPETTAEDGNCFQITVTNLSSIFIGGKPRIVEKPPTKARFLKPKDLLICNAAHNKSYIGRDITFYHGESDLLPSTEVMVIRVNKQLIPSSYLRAYFLTKLGYVQIQSTIRGITAHSYPVDVGKLEIPVPIMDDQKRDEWFACDDLMIKAGIANDLSVKLTQTAKFLIEALIEGQLTEAELINAHQALENGDNSLDKAILANITDKGYGVKGKPLFSDLDALYRLLDKVEADQTKGDL